MFAIRKNIFQLSIPFYALIGLSCCVGIDDDVELAGAAVELSLAGAAAVAAVVGAFAADRRLPSPR